MSDADPRTIKRDAADRALRFIYPQMMKQFDKSDITPQAAAFAFKVLIKVDKGARISAGLFKLYKVYTKWKQIPKTIAKAIKHALADPGTFKKNRVSIALIAKQHERNLKMHLRMPQTMPCPDFKKK